ncbi:MAG TPA: DUF3995 domain-containing protein [Dehalococcoidia bacterium]|nr:DUF3995 domain-containing protein [Dehalococcoidia bacterium]
MLTTAISSKRSPSLAWAGYAAFAWAMLFAALSFYWAAGGAAGVETNAPAITRLVLARDPVWIAILWATGALKVLAGLLALALVQRWGRVLPRRLLLAAGWAAFAIMALYEGAASLVQHALMVSGAISTPAGLGETSARWHLFLWDPWWLLGGVLFGLAAWRRQQRD